MTQVLPGWKNRIVGQAEVDPSTLMPHPHNWRIHGALQADAMAGILQEVGWVQRILVNQRTGRVIDGHLRLKLALDRQEPLVPVLYVDLSDGEEALVLSTIDPLSALAETDKGLLATLLGEVSSGETGIQRLLAQLAEQEGIVAASSAATPVVDVEPEIDRAEELRQQYGVDVGQLLACGNHRVICGDCTDKAVVERVLGNTVPRLMVTDPPYGVEYDANWRNEAAAHGKIGYAARRIGKVTNDDRVDWSPAWRLFPGAVAYTWSPGGDHVILTGLALQSAGYSIRNQIIWRKSHIPISRGHYAYQHEPCWYAVKRGATAHWIGDVMASTLWDIALDRNVEGGHSTQKPLECMARPIRNHDAPEVYDPFLGSGTTLVACENLHRGCYGIEIDPGYVAVSLHRWATLTGHTPLLLEG